MLDCDRDSGHCVRPRFGLAVKQVFSSVHPYGARHRCCSLYSTRPRPHIMQQHRSVEARSHSFSIRPVPRHCRRCPGGPVFAPGEFAASWRSFACLARMLLPSPPRRNPLYPLSQHRLHPTPFLAPTPRPIPRKGVAIVLWWIFFSARLVIGTARRPYWQCDHGLCRSRLSFPLSVGCVA